MSETKIRAALDDNLLVDADDYSVVKQGAYSYHGLRVVAIDMTEPNKDIAYSTHHAVLTERGVVLISGTYRMSLDEAAARC